MRFSFKPTPPVEVPEPAAMAFKPQAPFRRGPVDVSADQKLYRTSV